MDSRISDIRDRIPFMLLALSYNPMLGEEYVVLKNLVDNSIRVSMEAMTTPVYDSLAGKWQPIVLFALSKERKRVFNEGDIVYTEQSKLVVRLMEYKSQSLMWHAVNMLNGEEVLIQEYMRDVIVGQTPLLKARFVGWIDTAKPVRNEREAWEQCIATILKGERDTELIYHPGEKRIVIYLLRKS